ncbi:MAG: c-type cytochrome [Spirochaetia bacterium]|nr:c-type cytochrome [Spirochaetia bacterium]
MSLKKQIIAIALSLPALLAACAETEPPIYLPSAERLQLGAIYYAQAGCYRCHGTAWDGNGQEAPRLKQLGFTMGSFAAVENPAKTPIGYFKAVTAPVDYFAAYKQKLGEDEFKKFTDGHAFYSITDRGRWAISNFLYSLAPPLKGDKESKRQENYEKSLAEAKGVYDRFRKWEIGFKPLAEREKAPAGLIAAAKKEESTSRASVSDERRNVSFESSWGADLYKQNCKTCHGRYAEGTFGDGSTSGPRFGIRECPGQPRNCAVYAETRDLAGANVSAGALRDAHSKGSTYTPAFKSFTAEEWDALSGYLARLSGKK